MLDWRSLSERSQHRLSIQFATIGVLLRAMKEHGLGKVLEDMRSCTKIDMLEGYNDELYQDMIEQLNEVKDMIDAGILGMEWQKGKKNEENE